MEKQKSIREKIIDYIDDLEGSIEDFKSDNSLLRKEIADKNETIEVMNMAIKAYSNKIFDLEDKLKNNGTE